MKTRSLTHLALSGLMAIALTMTSAAGTSAETMNLFEDAGPKQTNEGLQTGAGQDQDQLRHIEVRPGGISHGRDGAEIYDEMDLQRATQAYMDFMPALSVYAIVKSHIRDFGFKNSSDIVVAAGPGWSPRELYLTGNNATVYACASLDLKAEGATVVDIPPGMYGTADDALFKFLVDFGAVGPDKGKGGKYLFLPPGYDGKVPEGYFAVRSPSYRIWSNTSSKKTTRRTRLLTRSGDGPKGDPRRQGSIASSLDGNAERRLFMWRTPRNHRSRAHGGDNGAPGHSWRSRSVESRSPAAR